ncbi:Zinc finger SWIM domain-containing protein [Trichinella pseudospiralis]|uniref:Zinc finger SWIM domain-containing protein n=1 Tax=Trichinella pseudospiralis TaxID=6337 RepID=A0A0V1J910_TRIPS|nr:Zinc finger SWIM domain-containing protein [Trichinella pseudospiralis]
MGVGCRRCRNDRKSRRRGNNEPRFMPEEGASEEHSPGRSGTFLTNGVSTAFRNLLPGMRTRSFIHWPSGRSMGWSRQTEEEEENSVLSACAWACLVSCTEVNTNDRLADRMGKRMPGSASWHLAAGSSSAKQPKRYRPPGLEAQEKRLQRRDGVVTLLDSAARVVAENYPLHVIEQRCRAVPEPVLYRVLLWAFPREELFIRLYSCPAPDVERSSRAGGPSSSAFVDGARLLDFNAVEDALQIDVFMNILFVVIVVPMAGLRASFNLVTLTHLLYLYELPTFRFGWRGCLDQGTSFASTEGHCGGSIVPVDVVNLCVPRPKDINLPFFCRPRSPCLAFHHHHHLYCCLHLTKIAFQNFLIIIFPCCSGLIWFHLSGRVRAMTGNELERHSFRISMAFDRCKITSIRCNCDNCDIYWCEHAVALALFRIRRVKMVEIRLPISESLYQMDRDQLQKFVQYLIAEHHVDVLPTAQHLADEIFQDTSRINAVAGAPDPTAGPNPDGDHRWFLDESQICSIVQSYMTQTICSEQLQTLFSKVREMLSERDENGPRLLRLITNQFLTNHCESSAFRAITFQTPLMADKCQQLWDQLGALWVCVVLNPYCRPEQKIEWQETLKRWVSVLTCPPENIICLTNQLYCDEHGSSDPDSPSTSNGGSMRWQGSGYRNVTRTVFHRALDACLVKWTDSLLKRILEDEDFCNENEPLWSEHVPTACARVDSLRTHGYHKQAIQLAMSIVRYMKFEQRRVTVQEQQLYQGNQGARPAPCEGWIGHPLDPINMLYDCLINAAEMYQTNSNVYTKCALEAALIALSQRRRTPPCLYAQQKAIKQEECLVQKLKGMTFDDTLFETMKIQAELILKSPSQYPMEEKATCTSNDEHERPFTFYSSVHSLASFLFQVFLPTETELAYSIGLKAIQWNTNVEGSEANALLSRPLGAVPVTNHGRYQQSSLASKLLIAAKDDVVRLRNVLEAVQASVRSPSFLYRLAHEVHREALSLNEDSSSRINLLNTAFELGLRVLHIAVSNPTWCRQEMIQWVVGCATALSFRAVLSLLSNWPKFFTPLEATRMVAPIIIRETITQLKLEYPQREEIKHAVHRLALECALKCPSNCAFHAIALCESDPRAFEAAYKLVMEVGEKNGLINAEEFFNIGRRMEQLGQSEKAYNMALLGLSRMRITHSDDASPLINSVYWACALGHSLGTMQLARVINLIVKHVQCATVLSDILRRCAFSSSHAIMPSSKHGPNSDAKLMLLSQASLKQLLNAAINAYIETVHSRLAHISPRHYNEFLDFLAKARETFVLSEEGHVKFSHLIEHMKFFYRGKKKLVTLIRSRFG